MSDVQKNYLSCLEKIIKKYLKAKNSLHTTRISSFKYVFKNFEQFICVQKDQI